MDIVWKKEVSKDWKAFVIRENKDVGLLTIQNKQTNIEKKVPVDLSFNADPNPEIDDIFLWEEIIERELKKS